MKQLFEIWRHAMNAIRTTEDIDHLRRRLLATATIGFAAAGAAILLPSQLAAAPAGGAIQPFKVNIPEEAIVDLRRRLAATRWPDMSAPRALHRRGARPGTSLARTSFLRGCGSTNGRYPAIGRSGEKRL